MYLLAHALVRLYRKSPEYSFATSGRLKWVNTEITDTEISVRVTEPKRSLLYFHIYQFLGRHKVLCRPLDPIVSK